MKIKSNCKGPQIIDNFLSSASIYRLNNQVLEYGKVHFFGYDNIPIQSNALYDLVSAIHEIIDYEVLGSTAWYNIRPKNPTWHNDISSYCTRNGKFYEPKILPPYTFIYYMREAKAGGNLTFRNGSTVKPIANRLAYFPASDDHKVEQYTGNRVSIGIIPWPEIPEEIFECKLTSKLSKTLNRIWEIEDGTLT